VSTNFAFDASGVTDNEDVTSVLEVRWDFDGDGTWGHSFGSTTKNGKQTYFPVQGLHYYPVGNWKVGRRTSGGNLNPGWFTNPN